MNIWLVIWPASESKSSEGAADHNTQTSSCTQKGYFLGLSFTFLILLLFSLQNSGGFFTAAEWSILYRIYDCFLKKDVMPASCLGQFISNMGNICLNPHI